MASERASEAERGATSGARAPAEPEAPGSLLRSVRFRLVVWFVAAIVVINSVLSLGGALQLGRLLVGETQTRVRLDLNSAHELYHHEHAGLARFLAASAIRRPVPGSLEQASRGDLGEVLRALRFEGKMDLLTLVSPGGRVVYRTHNPSVSGDDATTNPLVAQVLRDWQPHSGTLVLSRQELLREGASLAERAEIALVPTPAARSTEQTRNRSGMVVAAAVPFQAMEGGAKIVGVLYGARLLNGKPELVDAIKNQVFRGQRYEGRDAGTATIFLGDVRIATNVERENGSRALGTRLSAEVCSAVLDRGEVWADRAFVVNDWYITAYEPIRDPRDRIVGVLYVGLLQEPYSRRQALIVSMFLLLVGLSTAASVLMLTIVTNVVLKPIGSILHLAGKVRAGDLSARVGIRPPGEMGQLCEAIDAMAAAVENREQQLAHLTRQQIGQSEKLAAIGRLAAGIAHEINNPLTGVLTFAHMLRQKANMDAQDKEDLDVVLRETTRVREIVRGLLDFARESPSTRQPLDLNEVVARTLTLIRSQKGFHKVTLVEELDEALPPVVGDRNQLQQVLLNLCMNGCEAMHGGGVLSLRTRSEGNRVALEVSDSGCGIKPEHLGKIFDPFFTTKPVGKGTGLGLSVSYGIVEQHGGTLEVASEEGRGTTFTVRLPIGERGVS